MDAKEFTSALTRACSLNGLAGLLNKERTALFLHLTERMLEENEKYNLTAIKDADGIVLKHYVDCATLCAHLPSGARIADVGCGAGFPSLPLAILREDLDILAVDSTEKRVEYVRATAELFGLSGLRTRAARAEDLGRDPAFRERFDVVVSRAVADLPILAELCLPLLRVGGKMIAMKGKNAVYEQNAAKRAISILGGKPSVLIPVPLRNPAGGEEGHALVTVEKQSKTPATYPRSYAQISKKPL